MHTTTDCSSAATMSFQLPLRSWHIFCDITSATNPTHMLGYVTEEKIRAVQVGNGTWWYRNKLNVEWSFHNTPCASRRSQDVELSPNCLANKMRNDMVREKVTFNHS